MPRSLSLLPGRGLLGLALLGLALLGFGAYALLATRTGPVRILPVGDSITHGITGVDAGDPRVGGYRARLWRRLVDDGLAVDFVGDQVSGPADADRDHAGHDGWTIDQVRAGLRSWLPRFRPDVILLMVGTNDIWWGAAPDQAAPRLAALLDDVARRSPEAELVVAAIPPFADRELDGRAVAFNASLRTAVEERRAAGGRVRFVDAHGALDAGDLADGVHPTRPGYDKLADAWYAVLAPLLRGSRSSA